MGTTPSFYPSIRDQAIKNGYFAKISSSDLENPLFAKYDIGFKEIKSDYIVFKGPKKNNLYTNKDFANTVCEISFPGKCRLVPILAEGNENMYDLVDASYDAPKKLISVCIHREITHGKISKFSLKYQIHR